MPITAISNSNRKIFTLEKLGMGDDDRCDRCMSVTVRDIAAEVWVSVESTETSSSNASRSHHETSLIYWLPSRDMFACRHYVKWKHLKSSRAKKCKVTKPAGKLIVTVFWDAFGILSVDIIHQRHIISGAYYVFFWGENYKLSSSTKDKDNKEKTFTCSKQCVYS